MSRYYGVDDSEEAINSAVRVHGKTPKWSFHLQDYVRGDLPQADLLGSRAALLVTIHTPSFSTQFHVYILYISLISLLKPVRS